MYGRKSFLQQMISPDTNNKKIEWNVRCSDGAHKIAVRLGQTIRSPKNIFIDEDFLTTVYYKGKSIIPKQEYQFECGGDTLILVVHSNKVDLVHKGILQESKIKYEPRNNVPLWLRIIFLASTASSVLVIPALLKLKGVAMLARSSLLGILLGLSMSLSCTFILLSVSSTPLRLKSNKMILSFLVSLWSWAIQFIIFFVLLR